MMNDALQLAGLVLSLGGAVGTAIAAVVGMRDGRRLDCLDGKLDVLSGRVDEQGKTLQSLMGALSKTP